MKNSIKSKAAVHSSLTPSVPICLPKYMPTGQCTYMQVCEQGIARDRQGRNWYSLSVYTSTDWMVHAIAIVVVGCLSILERGCKSSIVIGVGVELEASANQIDAHQC